MNGYLYLGALLGHLSCLLFGYLTAPSGGSPLYWPASGLLLAVLLLAPVRHWPLVLCAALLDGMVVAALVDAWQGEQPLSKVVSATIAAALLRNWPGRRVRWTSFNCLLRVVVGGSLLGASLGTFLSTVHLIGSVSPASHLLVWKAGWLAHSLGILTLTPLALWMTEARRPALEAALTLACTALLAAYIFRQPDRLALPFLLFLPLVWTAARLGPWATAVASTATAALGTSLTGAGHGPFMLLGESSQARPAAQMFILTLTLSALAIATNLSDRRISVGRRDEARKRSKSAEDRYEALFEHSAVAVLVLKEGIVVRANRAARELFGYSEDELQGALLTAFSAPNSERNVEFQNSWRDAFESVTELPWTARRSDGSTLELQLHFSSLETASGPAFQVVIQDKTRQFELRKRLEMERRRLQQEVEAATQKLEQAHRRYAVENELRERFLATVSHELRTPLSAVLAHCETLKEELWGPLTEEQHLSLSRIAESGLYLDELIRDLLDLARVQGAAPQPEPEPHAVDKLCSSVLRLVQNKAQTEGITLEVAPLPSEEVMIDGRFVKPILINLLTNAIKFTPSGGRAGLEAMLDDGELRLVVWDTGPGVPPEVVPRLFEPFTRADESVPGFGLGLSLVRKFTHLLGGRVAHAAGRNGGSRFEVAIPVS